MLYLPSISIAVGVISELTVASFKKDLTDNRKTHTLTSLFHKKQFWRQGELCSGLINMPVVGNVISD